MPSIRTPTKQQLQAAYGQTIPDVAAPGLKLLFVGINPSLYSAAVGHHFARPGNRFWPTLHAAGFTKRLLVASQQVELLDDGYGITNMVERATARADELSREDVVAGAKQLAKKIQRLEVGTVAFLGITAYRQAFQRPGAAMGRQPEDIGAANVWVLPNPSGLNAHYQLPKLAELFAELRASL